MSYRDISCERLHELLTIDIEAGKLFWKARPASMFKTCRHMTDQQKANAFNSKFAGKPAIDCLDGNGYLTGCILRNMVLAHRVIYCMTHGVWPVEIDHINGDKVVNVPANIRDAGSHMENSLNLPKRRDNKSGVTGVSLDKRRGTWIVHAKGRHVGSYQSFDDAVSARLAANENLGFHKNHGRK